MNKLLEINSYGNNDNAFEEIVSVLDNDGVVAIPTDSGYSLACKMKSKRAIDKIRKIRDLDSEHNFTLICKDLSEISEYAKVDNNAYRILRRCTPGAYTFILLATKKVSSLLVKKNKKTVGIRVPTHYVPLNIIARIGEPLVTSSFILPGEQNVVTDCSEVSNSIMNNIDLVIESEYCGFESTTVVDMLEMPFSILREGAGDINNII